MIVETQDGQYKNIRIKQNHNDEKIRVEMYNIGTFGYTFIFSLVGDKRGDKKHNYFIIQKTFDEINNILGADNNHSLIQTDTEVHVFRPNDFYGSEAQIMKNYLEVMTFKELMDLTKQHQDDRIHLSFEKIFDNATKLDSIPIIF